jgi:uncharacterized protein (TIGR02271 family)
MNSKIDWKNVIKKEARGVNNEDFGEVQDVSNGYIFVQRGIINKEKFFIPEDKAESFEGDILRFSVSKEFVSNNYQQDSCPEYSTQSEDNSTTMMHPQKVAILVIEEKLDITKKAKGSHVSRVKEWGEERRTVKVPVVYEKISLEKRPTAGEQTKTSHKPITTRQRVEITLKHQEMELTKNPYAREEIMIQKKPLTKTRPVTKEERIEKLDSRSME